MSSTDETRDPLSVAIEKAMTRMMSLASRVSPNRDEIATALQDLAHSALAIGKRESGNETAGEAIDRIKELVIAKEATEKYAKILELQIDRMKSSEPHALGVLRREMRDMAERAAQNIEQKRNWIERMLPRVEAYEALLKVINMTQPGSGQLGQEEDLAWRLRQRVRELDAQRDAEKREQVKAAERAADRVDADAAQVSSAPLYAGATYGARPGAPEGPASR